MTGTPAYWILAAWRLASRQVRLIRPTVRTVRAQVTGDCNLVSLLRTGSVIYLEPDCSDIWSLPESQQVWYAPQCSLTGACTAGVRALAEDTICTRTSPASGASRLCLTCFRKTRQPAKMLLTSRQEAHPGWPCATVVAHSVACSDAGVLAHLVPGQLLPPRKVVLQQHSGSGSRTLHARKKTASCQPRRGPL